MRIDHHTANRITFGFAGVADAVDYRFDHSMLAKRRRMSRICGYIRVACLVCHDAYLFDCRTKFPLRDVALSADGRMGLS
jgi:hypothetical protein